MSERNTDFYVTNVILTTKRTPISRKKGRKTHGEQLSLFCIDSDIFLLNWGLKTNQSCKFRVNRPLNVGLDYIWSFDSRIVVFQEQIRVLTLGKIRKYWFLYNCIIGKQDK
jgi:hypothetical protein